MKLENFENYFNDVILARGREYYWQDRVMNIVESEPDLFITEVEGSEDYTVSVRMNEAGIITRSHCDCPYDFSEFCKHQAAVFFALRDFIDVKAAGETTEDLGYVLIPGSEADEEGAAAAFLNARREPGAAEDAEAGKKEEADRSKDAGKKEEAARNKNTGKKARAGLVKKKAAIKPDLPSILSNLGKEELISIILAFSKAHPDIEKSLLFKYAPVEDEVAVSKKMIREYINKAKRQGFIDWRNADYAVTGADITLDKAEDRIEDGEIESAIKLCLVVLPIATTMLNYTDDSNGSVGDVIRRSLHLIDTAASEAAGKLDAKKQARLFGMMVKEAKHARYDGWSDKRIDLLESCLYFAEDPALRSKLKDQLGKMLEQTSEGSWNDRYSISEIRLLQLNMIERFEGAEEAWRFIQDNIQHSKFRELAIKKLLEKGKPEEAVALCIEGEAVNEGWRGLVSQWEDFRYQAYEMMGDAASQRELATKKVCEGELTYFYKLKELYGRDEWNSKLHEILEVLEKQKFIQDIYLEILIHEDLNEKLLSYVKMEPRVIETVYPYLIDDYRNQVEELFCLHIEGEAEAAGGRPAYKKVCQIIRKFKKACGGDAAAGLVSDLTKAHARRPAFLDEMEKIK
ncbi:SWIM zinc finger family protein [Mesobacillus zeae]|uniref:SWIM-type domain-containing protein n=1 Tax=Mesobacillus zeae TaxID=1917180 RepID=A0A398B4J8_9BACI|nr:DUF6880 family protein [Mesobacillus zeae]RID82686.1 hypothetical protein D1970_18310 [Mesobacillus zeae]